MTATNTREAAVLYSFAKNANERVQASISEYKGNTYADVRVYYEADGGEWRPTKKGITVALDLLPELLKAVQALEREANRVRR